MLNITNIWKWYVIFLKIAGRFMEYQEDGRANYYSTENN